MDASPGRRAPERAARASVMARTTGAIIGAVTGQGHVDELDSTADDTGSLTPSQELGSLGSVLRALSRTESATLAPGTLVADQYRIVRPIGEGGMGLVFLARDVRLDRDVAVKLCTGLSASAVHRIQREAMALAKLAHPNVVVVFQAGELDGRFFIAMEYVAGGTARSWLAAAPRTPRAIVALYVAAGGGLAAAHAAGLVHRDFKPDNVLVGDDGRPRVLDFGLARPPDAPGAAPGRPPVLPAAIDPRSTILTADGQVVGTPAYMAPEQHLGEPADARSDQFSFAVALYHAVYGVRPFTGDDPRALALSIVRGRVRPATPRYPVPEWLDRLLVRSLSVDPAQRFPSMEALLGVLEARLAADAPELRALPTRAVLEELDDGPGDAVAVREELGLSPSMHTPREPVMVSAVPPPARPAEETEEGLVTSISTRRSLPEVLDGTTLVILTRELDRLGGKRGKVERLGACMTWSTRKLEVHVDVTARGSEIFVWRRMTGELRIRTVAWMLFGTWLGSLFLAVTLGGMELDEVLDPLVPLIVMASLLGGAVMGYRKALGRHVRSLPAVRADLEFVADRLVALSRANAPRELRGG